MRRVILVAAVTGLFSSGLFAADETGGVPKPDAKPEPPQVELQVGDPAPEFEATNDAGEIWKSAEHVGKRWVVVYFYPGDFTPGCTRQAEEFRNNARALVEQGVEVVGVSGDSVTIHERFKKDFELNYTLLADEQGDIATKFGVPVRRQAARVRPRGPDRKPVLDDLGQRWEFERPVTFGRWTFVIDPDGKVAYKNTKVRPDQDSQQVLEFIKERASSK